MCEADIVAPSELMDTNRRWSEKAISFLKSDVQNHNWKANLVGNYGECQVLRLFYPLEHHLLATTMIRQGFGVPSETYQEAVSTQWILYYLHLHLNLLTTQPMCATCQM